VRLVLLCCFSAVLGIAATRVESSSNQQTEVTVIMDFKGRYSAMSLGEMKREVASIMKGTGFVFDWRFRSQAGANEYSSLIVVNLTGDCIIDPSREIPKIAGPLAFAHTSGSNVLRFADVHCDSVSRLVQTVYTGRENSDLLFGKALGRVLAHEFCHILGNTFDHSEDGILRSTFSARQLISRRFDLDPVDLDRLRFRHAQLEH
jgi:hypothetical protein